MALMSIAQRGVNSATILSRLLDRKETTHLQAALQRVAQVLCDFVNADATHGPHSQRPDQRVGILGVLHQQGCELLARLEY